MRQNIFIYNNAILLEDIIEMLILEKFEMFLLLSAVKLNGILSVTVLIHS